MNAEQKEMVLIAIDSHIGVLYGAMEAYRRNGDAENVKEVMSEIRKYENLKQNIKNL